MSCSKLNILFICGSLEPGKDGVGDYTLKLAERIATQGYCCTCISINDAYSKTASSESTFTFVNEVTVYRLSSLDSWYSRRRKLTKLVNLISPHWISFQYVPYAYSAKGLPFVLLTLLPKLKHNKYWNVMCHELWVDPKLKLVNKLLSLIQRSIITALLFRLKPCIINTSCFYYQKLISQCWHQANILPLFSTIEFNMESKLTRQPKGVLVLVFFASIHKEWNHQAFFSRINLARMTHNISSCVFQLIGNAGVYGDNLWNSLAYESTPNFIFERHRDLRSSDISSIIQNADFGVTSTPSHLIEKSASVAAMQSHGLPVIIPRISSECVEWNKKLKDSKKFILMDDDFISALISTEKFPPVDMLEQAASMFLSQLAGFKSR